MPDPSAELEALRTAIAVVADDLQQRADAADGEVAEVLDAQAMMVADPELADAAASSVRDGALPAARAIVEAGEVYASALAESTNEYLAERATDVRDVCDRVARQLLGRAAPDLAELPSGSIVVAHDLAPVDTAGLDPTQVAGLVLEAGSRTSHAAILARAIGVPAVVAVTGVLDAVEDGQVLGIDGDEGTVHLGEAAVRDAGLRGRAEAAAAERDRLAVLAGDGPGATADGHRIELAANIGSVADLRTALAAGAQGVGLLRTEFEVLDQHEAPTEDEQYERLREAVDLLDGGKLVVRTFDLGADKPARFLPVEAEENPALGVRGIRLARAHPELLDAQLRAVRRAADHGPVAVMAPMVATLAEVRWFIARAEAAGLRDAGVELGVMIEVPAAVLTADAFAAELDFLSIGTNDLTQYLHAADRQNGALAALQDPFAPAVLRAVQQVCDAASAPARRVGVCGEAAGVPAWALEAVGLGVTELWMGAA
ncbi:MAG: phosphoenolpyruvate--protein phosphotransferase, partial [Nitriliruptor sp.]